MASPCWQWQTLDERRGCRPEMFSSQIAVARGPGLGKAAQQDTVQGGRQMLISDDLQSNTDPLSRLSTYLFSGSCRSHIM